MTITSPAPPSAPAPVQAARIPTAPRKAQSHAGLLQSALRDALLSALVALALGIPIWAYETVDGPEGLFLKSRWLLVAGFFASVFLLRLGLQYFFWSREDSAEQLARFTRYLLTASALAVAASYAFEAWLPQYHSIGAVIAVWLVSAVLLVAGFYAFAERVSPAHYARLYRALGAFAVAGLGVTILWMALKAVAGSGFLSRSTLGLAQLLLPVIENWRIILPVMAAFAIGYVLMGDRGVKSETASTGTAPLLPGIAASAPQLVPLVLIAIGVLAATFPLLPFANRYLIVVAILILIYVMLGWGLNVVVGLAGLLDLGYVAFYAVGAYSFALLAQWYGLSFWVCLPLAGILAAFWGVILGFPVLRLRGDYLAIVTLAFGEIVRLILINWQDVTGGPGGLGRIPGPSFPMLQIENGWPSVVALQFTDGEANSFNTFFGIAYVPVHRFIFLYYIILVLALVTNFVTLRLRRLPIGRAWEALREDEIACRSLGINTTNTKLTAFAIGAMFGGVAGSFYATWQGSISPESFNFMESAIILAIVVLGGMGSQPGVAAAAFVMIGGIEVLRNLEFLKTLFKSMFDKDFDPNEYRMLVFGIAMVLIMLFKPRGFVGVRTPTVFLKERKAIGAENVKEGHG